LAGFVAATWYGLKSLPQHGRGRTVGWLRCRCPRRAEAGASDEASATSAAPCRM